MSELFGFTPGRRAFAEDQRTQQMHQAKLAEFASVGQERAAAAPGKLAYTQSLTAQAEAVAAKHRQEAQAEAVKLMALADGDGPPPTTQDELYASLMGKANRLNAAGMPEEAAKLLSEISQSVSRFASAEAAGERTKTSALAQEITALEQLQTTLAGVDSPEAHATAQATWAANPASQVMPMPDVLRAYNPDNLRAFLGASPAKIAAAKLKLEEGEAASRNANRADLIQYRGFRKKVADQQLDIARTAETRRGAAGGTVNDRPVGAAPQSLRISVGQELKRLELAPDDETELQALVTQLADDAHFLHKRGNADTHMAAVLKVIEEAKGRGELDPQPKWLGISTRKTYTPKDGSISRPLVAPPDPAKRREGTYYRDEAGVTAQWTGKGWTVLSQPSPARVSNLMDPGDDDAFDEE